MRVESGFIELSKLDTMNKIERMPKWERAKLARTYVDKAVVAWTGRIKPKLPCHFSMTLVIQKNALQTPDVDAMLWVAKRVLDGAALANIIPDDSFQYVHSVCLERPLKLLLPSEPYACLQGVFEC